jgi:hypothetical protein
LLDATGFLAAARDYRALQDGDFVVYAVTQIRGAILVSFGGRIGRRELRALQRAQRLTKFPAKSFCRNPLDLNSIISRWISPNFWVVPRAALILART